MMKNEIAITEVLLNTYDISSVRLPTEGMTYFWRCDTPEFSGTVNTTYTAAAMNTESILYFCKFMS
jgi:hypothetical protein